MVSRAVERDATSRRAPRPCSDAMREPALEDEVVARFDPKPDAVRRPEHEVKRDFGTDKQKKKIIPNIPVWEKSDRQDGIFSRSDFRWDRKRGVPKAWFTCGPRSNSTQEFIRM